VEWATSEKRCRVKPNGDVIYPKVLSTKHFTHFPEKTEVFSLNSIGRYS